MGRGRKSKSINLFADDAADIISPKEQKASLPKNIRSSEYVIRKYVGRTTCGFIHNHKYLVKLSSNSDVGFTVWAIEDLTDSDEVDIGLKIASENSWNYFFKVV